MPGLRLVLLRALLLALLRARRAEGHGEIGGRSARMSRVVVVWLIVGFLAEMVPGLANDSRALAGRGGEGDTAMHQWVAVDI